MERKLLDKPKYIGTGKKEKVVKVKVEKKERKKRVVKV